MPSTPHLSTERKSDFTVERRDQLSFQAFAHDYMWPRKPVVLTDATAAWKANTWTPQFFLERYPGKVLQTDQGEMTMESFIQAITKDTDEPGPFLREQPLEDVFPDLMDHVEPTPSYVDGNWLADDYKIDRINRRLNRESKLEVNFCGRRVFPYLHVDDLGVHAFITQHYGSKEFTILPPDQEPYLYRRPGERFSEIVDIENLDVERYPLFEKARRATVTVHAGESLFVPHGWWHTTRVRGASLSTVISLSNASNWADLVRCLRDSSRRRWVGYGLAGYMTGIGTLKRLRARVET